jgi:hypothetical protein
LPTSSSSSETGKFWKTTGILAILVALIGLVGGLLRQVKGGDPVNSPNSSPTTSASPSNIGTQVPRCFYEAQPTESSPIDGGGYVDQAFIAKERFLTAVVVRMGLDPNRADVSRKHPVELYLRSDDGKTEVLRPLPDIENNQDTWFHLDSVPVEIGTTYRVRITNKSNEAVGFYLSPIHLSGNAVEDPDNGVLLDGHEGERYRKTSWALSRCIEGFSRK